MAQKPPKQRLLQKVFCLFGKHHRNAQRARRSQGVWYSHCTGCGSDMIKRDDETGWILLSFPKRKRDAGGMGKRRRS